MHFVFCLWLAAFFGEEEPVPPRDHPLESYPALVEHLADWMDLADVPGASVAIVDAERIETGGFGRRGPGGAAFHAETVVEAASLSKPVFAYGVLQLVDQGILELDRPLAEYLTYPDIEGDPRAARITARMVLSHSSGLPNWRPGDELSTEFEPGARFQYSGEGFVYLQRVVEKLTALPLESWMQAEVFGPLGMISSSFVFEPRFEPDCATGYRPDGSAYRRARSRESNAAGSLHTTAGDFGRFLQAVLMGRGGEPATSAACFTPQIEIDDQRAWGLGFGLVQRSGTWAAWQWGHNSGYRAFMLLDFDLQRAAAVFTNSDNGMRIVDSILAATLGGDRFPFDRIGYSTLEDPGLQAQGQICRAFRASAAEGFAAFEEWVRDPLHAEAGDAILFQVGERLCNEQRVETAAAIYARLARREGATGDRALARAIECDLLRGDAAAAARNLEALVERRPHEPGLAALRQHWDRGASDDVRRRRVEFRISERMRSTSIPGASIALIEGGDIVWATGLGVLRSGGADPVTTDSLFQAASISKPVAAFAALKLVEDGALDLDEDVNEMLLSWQVPAHEFEGTVSLRHLLSHTAGVTVHGFPGYDSRITAAHLLDVLQGIEPANTGPIFVDTPPGRQFRYSGGGYCIVQQLVIDTTDQEFPDALWDLVLEPLGMVSSTYAQPLPTAWQARASHAHQGSEPGAGGWHVYPEMAAAGLWTTATDLARFAVEILQVERGRPGRVVSPATVREMLTSQNEAGIGLGLFLKGEGPARSFEHSGSNFGFRCEMIAFPETGQGAVLMTNSSRGGELFQPVREWLGAEYDWPTPPE